MSTFFVAAASSIYYILSDWMKGQNEKQELANQTLQSELKFLKSQINPHFLFNTLNSLYALTLKKSDLAPEIVLKLSEMMRYMLYECNEKYVSLEKEVNYVINYLDLEKLRHGKKINIHFQQSGEIRNQLIAPLLFIPFIENCFKHGVSHQIAEAFVDIKININGQEVSVEIENSKHAVMPGAHQKKSGGIGLVNVKRRLDLLYADAYELKITDTPTTYKVTLFLKLSPHN
ncbi:MAG: histidine kinase [Saprospiraceae bacterium]|nr:histidine kinase [Saprospiraceae bacterium]